MTTTYWFAIVGEYSDLCGEEFLTELENASKQEHIDYAHRLFSNEEIRCYGRVSEFEAEMMGLDTYQKNAGNRIFFIVNCLNILNFRKAPPSKFSEYSDNLKRAPLHYTTRTVSQSILF